MLGSYIIIFLGWTNIVWPQKIIWNSQFQSFYCWIKVAWAIVTGFDCSGPKSIFGSMQDLSVSIQDLGKSTQKILCKGEKTGRYLFVGIK